MRAPESDPERFERECAGKEPLPSESAAEALLAMIRREQSARRACWLVTYPCRFCGQYHLGNTRRHP